ncbi:murein hydrolase activator NlpD [Proteus terrae]|uniref:murein hydrolase activator NlpD n=1 Tax=Proteus terrae TaxID=1574161 RepID=UPI0013E07EC7|nr:murein hydrolase activator NlpD [Proteus terrae]QIF99044.1 murein hydrolase activator NlpD [Proteus terrae subsp. cibarius]QUT01063.1 murein hydrolase activator NlpD [Proteus terrae subsp. cibarius]
MNSESPIKHVRWAIMCSVIGFALTGCADTPYRPAPITSVNDSSSNNTVSTAPVVTNSNATPIERTTPLQSSPPPSIKVNSASSNGGMVQSQNQSRPQTSVAAQNVSTDGSGRIVYNRNYDSIPKGNYSGNTYTVKRGDTMFYIAWITDSDVKELASMNNIPEPYSLNVGQVLNIGNRQVNTGTNTNVNTSVINQPSSAGVQTAQTKPTNNTSMGPLITKPATTPPKTTTPPPPTNTNTTTTAKSAPTTVSGKWIWPAQGNIIESYSSAPGGNKGIDIGGTKGSPIVATAAGKVVYAGSALRGYGNLVIIKHNDEYLSAYAHNDTILVREQQNVNAGQQIATMGSSGTSSVRLHFEIRYKEKSLNPMSYLPKK